MRFTAIISALFMAIVGTNAIPLPLADHSSLNVTIAQSEHIEPRDTYKCTGAKRCHGPSTNIYCDNIVNNELIRNSTALYGDPNSQAPYIGVCYADRSAFGCRVTIAGGPRCRRSGADIWNDYQDIRHAGCERCGVKTYVGQCQTHVNYVDWCNPDDRYSNEHMTD
ncbi:hypothetical protein F4819DRAFT_492563 [Hypoxylon fuscum]|nr:hypothetical protein F4819DRAFT_492563 [Hypoxylon fuscum]